MDQNNNTNSPNYQGRNRPRNPNIYTQRMGILVQPPSSFFPHQSINWTLAVVGMFFDTSPPNSSLVYNIVNNHWESRDTIRVFRTGPYFILECQDPADRDAILHYNTTFIDGKPITFRPCSAHQIPTSINFNMGRIWVRVHDLPWDYLNTDWTVRILSHVGLIEAIENHGSGIPQQPYLRAKLIVDLTLPLIPGCFLPLEGNRVSWVYFRYEGIYKFCKECGCVGHNTGRCTLSAFDAQRIIQRRVHGFENNGMTVLQTQSGIPLYTNLIRGLPDRFLHRNPRLNLTRIPPHMAGPQFDPYLYPHLYLFDHGESDSSMEDYYDATPDFQAQATDPHIQYYSDDNSQNHTNPPPDFSNASFQNQTPIRWEENITASPGRRFGLESDPRGYTTGYHHRSATPTSIALQIDLNLPPDHSAPDPNVKREPNLNEDNPSSTSGLSQWARRSVQIASRLCGSFGNPRPVSPQLLTTPNNQDQVNTLEGLVAQGWPIEPPGPQEAGPSNWVDRAQEQALNEMHGILELGLDHQNLSFSNSSNEPDELRNISHIINSRFRISPPPFADFFNPLLQETGRVNGETLHSDHQRECYSPTSPLDFIPLTDDRGSPSETNTQRSYHEGTMRTLSLELPDSVAMFTGKRRRDASYYKSQSLDSYLRLGDDDFQARSKRKKRRMEEWDAKGGFTIPRGPNDTPMRSKAITDEEMALTFGVTPDGNLLAHKGNKRMAGSSPQQRISKWFNKKIKDISTKPCTPGSSQHLIEAVADVTQAPAPPQNTTMIDEHVVQEMAIQLSLAFGQQQGSNAREVVDPYQPPKSS